MTDQEKDKLIHELLMHLMTGYLIWSTPEVYCGKSQSDYWIRAKKEFLDKYPELWHHNI